MGRRTDKKVFDHTEKILKDAIHKLKAKVAGETEEGAIRQAATAGMLARLYFDVIAES